jgi:hypothetical protein
MLESGAGIQQGTPDGKSPYRAHFAGLYSHLVRFSDDRLKASMERA